jgi:mannose-6-phosphate isomerase-like protein (cupin superfamily)
MQKIVLFLIIPLLLSAGCLTSAPAEAVDGSLRVLTPSDPFPIYNGEGIYTTIITAMTQVPPVNYSLGYVIIAPGNATPPHRLIGTSELVYVIKGTARIVCDNEEVTAGEGELLLLPEGVLQSISAHDDTELHYLSVNQPPYRDEIQIKGEELTLLSMRTNAVPIIVSDPGQGIEWDFDTGTLIYTLINPVLMPEKEIPIDYSVASAEILHNGSLVRNQLLGLSELIYVIEGEITITSPDGEVIHVPAGSAGYIPAGQIKEIQNTKEGAAKILSFVDPAWRLADAIIIG